MRSGNGDACYGLEGLLGASYLYIGQPERALEWCRTQPARSTDAQVGTRVALVITLLLAGFAEDARVAATALIDAAEATAILMSLLSRCSPTVLRFATPIPVARDALHRGLVIALDSGNRGDESRIAAVLCHLEARHGDPLAAFAYLAVAIRNYHDAGNSTNMGPTLSFLVAILDRIGRHESAATIAGFAVVSPLATEWTPEITTAITHLRRVLGDENYESLAHKGETMTTAAMAAYAHDQIDQARTELTAVSK